MNMEALNEVRVKDEQIDDSQSISDTSRNNRPNNKITNNKQSIKHEREFIPISETNKRTREDMSIDDQPKHKRQSLLENKLKEEPIDCEIQTSIDIVVKTEEEKFSAREEFSNKTSIAFLNEEETTTTTNDDIQATNPKSK